MEDETKPLIATAIQYGSGDVKEHARPALERQHSFFGAAAHPRTRTGRSITSVRDAFGPGACCGFLRFYPTNAVITAADENGVEHRYLWNARAHRKMRFPTRLPAGDAGSSILPHPPKFAHRFRFLSWEPRNITWYICWIGFVANTLWVVNGIYTVWPDLARTDTGATYVCYYTGVVGAFLFIVCGYLGFVEAINHTHDEVRIPTAGDDDGVKSASGKGSGRGFNERATRPLSVHYGVPRNPLGLSFRKGLGYNPENLQEIVESGYPVVQDASTGAYVTSDLFDRALAKYDGNVEEMAKNVRGKLLKLRLGEHVVRVRIESLHDDDATTISTHGGGGAGGPKGTTDSWWSRHSIYSWWSRHPDLHHIGVFNALVFFIATIVFWIPALVWWPMEALGDPDLAATIFWVYVLQIIPSVGFIYVGHTAMAEASGSWIRPDPDSIGWWISLFNTVGGYGFLLCPVLDLPAVVGAPGCCDDLARWGASLATFWGSCAFWLAGLLQCVEFSSEHPLSLRGAATVAK